MKPFDYTAAQTVSQALAGGGAGTAYLAGGTTLVDLMKLEVMTPGRVVDINRLPLRGVSADRTGLHLGALERMSDVAAHPLVADGYPVLAQALLRSASPQLRNMASIGGNLLQRVRCGYFRDTSTGCNKRRPGSGCPAVGGENRGHAILGTSDSCVATHPSDLAVALVALDARVRLAGRNGTSREVWLADFYLLPGDTPEREHDLRPGELVTRVTVPALPWAARSAYLKIRDRQSYEFALASAAVALDLRGGVIRDVRLAVGGVGTRPWRLPAVEEALRGRAARPELFESAAALAVEGARPLAHNRFKTTLLRRTVVRALTNLAESR
ncbi:xanthine dehydrogenase family protein subunit M [Micromonospora sp. WMMD1102]|uniref:FAD binding domain-containing protein n=1 Tax=Micromonospora sp. WMMD1102 TaxID=3016105 RepID=UPI002414E4F2|nr:xanthine dehydrogenase family protein subunit M [Micromonospora sp. WMMD1102]MDG4787520.1 xanthine dehydrogenase family protein subunit M [Micromonospora sp. WMMD1102]